MTHSDKEKYIGERINEFITEFRSLFTRIENKEIIPERMQLIGAFTIIDVLASYWFEYLGITGTQKERFFKFVENFCFCVSNQEFTRNDFLQFVNKNAFYGLRSALVHFYGLGNEKFAIVPDPSPMISNEKINRVINATRIIEPSIVIIQPRHIRDIVIESATLMFQEMIKVIKNAQSNNQIKQKHISGIERIYVKLIKEGAIKEPANSPLVNAL